MILRYKATIPGNRIFMREYDIDARMSLYRLHEFLDRDLGFSPDQMTLFETVSSKGKLMRRIGLFDFGDGAMDMITVENTVSRDEHILRYVYNVNLDLYIELLLESESEYSPRNSYPMLVAEKGRNPDQFSAVYDDYDEFAATAPVRSAASCGDDDDDADDDDESFDEDELPEGEEEV